MASFLSTRAKKFRKRMLSEFFYRGRRTQHHLPEGQHHFERSENIIVRLRRKTMLRQVANDVLRNDVVTVCKQTSPNDVALRANRLTSRPFYDILKPTTRKVVLL